jgi:hypothetical protein
MQILRRFDGSIQRYSEELSDPSRLRNPLENIVRMSGEKITARYS